MSSTLPTTLENMQYEILQGDLSINPRLQASTIPAKDKELKTVSKKIIPAINELLKLLNTCKQSVETYSEQIEDKVNAVGLQLQETLKASQLEAITEQMSEVETQTQTLIEEMKTTVKQDVMEQLATEMDEIKQSLDTLIENKMQNGEAGTGGKEMKREFHSKITIPKNQTCTVPFKASELQDVNKQFDVYNYSSSSKLYTKVEEPFKFSTSSSSNYETFTKPVDFRINPDTDEITFKNVSGLYEVVVYIFTLE